MLRVPGIGVRRRQEWHINLQVLIHEYREIMGLGAELSGRSIIVITDNDSLYLAAWSASHELEHTTITACKCAREREILIVELV